MEYRLSTNVSNLHAIYQPSFSIPSLGNVPRYRSGTLFCHYLIIIPCVPKKTSTQTFVHISANYIPIFKISAPLESAVHLQ